MPETRQHTQTQHTHKKRKTLLWNATSDRNVKKQWHHHNNSEETTDTPTRQPCVAQKHLRCTMVGPDSSYSPLEIHICWNVDKEHRMDPPIHMPDAKCCKMSDAKSTRNLDANRIQNSDAKCCKTSDAKCCKMSNAKSTHHPAGEHRWIQKDQLVMAKENRNAEKDACQDNTHIDGFVLVVNRPPPNCRRERKSERMLQQDLAAPGSRPQRENRD